MICVKIRVEEKAEGQRKREKEGVAMYFLHTRITLEGKEEVYKVQHNPQGEYVLCDGLHPDRVVTKDWLLSHQKQVGNLLVLPTGEIDCVQGWVSIAQKTFFKGTQVVNADNSLKICCLGSSRFLDMSKIRDSDVKGKGVYCFTDSLEVAKREGKYIFPCFLLIRNPLLLQEESMPLLNKLSSFLFDKPFVKEHLNDYLFKCALEKRGYDGAVWKEGTTTYYMPFSRCQFHLIIERTLLSLLEPLP